MLKRIFSFSLFVFLLVSISAPLFAQHSIQSISSVDMDNLSDEQVRQIMNEIESRGLTMQQAVELAKTQGASPQQINKFMQRMQSVQTSSLSETSTSKGSQAMQPGSEQNMVQPGSYNTYRDSLQRRKDTVITEKNRKIFGFRLFNKDNLTFEPSVNIPVSPDYVLSIGDEVVINVWGASQQTYQLPVDKEGTINIPDLGPVKVADMDYSSVKDIIIKRLTAIYNGMTGPNPVTFADVSVNNLRAIKVHVIGEAILPGTYTLSATASAFNALFLSGGPNENGSFRNIRVIRNNQQIAEIDVYDYLINGNTKNNISLRNQDVIFISTYQKRVETSGAFKRNGIFELRNGENIEQLLNFTGGFSENASTSRLLITRFTDDQFKLIDLDKSEFATVGLNNGDFIRAEKVITRFENRLTIEGAVFRPGNYALEDGMTLSGLIQKAGGLREDFFARRGLIIRLDEQLYPSVLSFDLDEVTRGINDPTLQREDQVIIRDIFSMGEKQTIRIFGEVMKPKQYDFSRNMTLKDLMFLAGGMTEAASESQIEVARRNTYEESSVINSKMVTLFQFNISRSLGLSEEDASFKLKPFDQVYIRRAPSYQTQKTVHIRGEVKYPGEYSISDKNERVSDLVERAGGLTPTAFPGGARMKRMPDEQLSRQREIIRKMRERLDTLIVAGIEEGVVDMELRLESILAKRFSEFDYFLKEGDEIYIPMTPEGVWVNGEVLSPMGLAWERGRGVKHYVDNSGGFGPEARKGKVYVVYSNGTTAVTKGFIVRSYPRVEPGSQVIVPAKAKKDKSQNTSMWLAFASVFSSLAIAAAAVIPKL